MPQDTITAGGKTLATLEESFGKIHWQDGRVRVAVRVTQADVRASKQFAVRSSLRNFSSISLPWLVSEAAGSQITPACKTDRGEIQTDASLIGAVDALFAEILEHISTGELEPAAASVRRLKSLPVFCQGVNHERKEVGSGCASDLRGLVSHEGTHAQERPCLNPQRPKLRRLGSGICSDVSLQVGSMLLITCFTQCCWLIGFGLYSTRTPWDQQFEGRRVCVADLI